MSTWQEIGKLIEKQSRLEIDISFEPAVSPDDVDETIAESPDAPWKNHASYHVVLTRQHRNDSDAIHYFRYEDEGPTAAEALYKALTSDSPAYEVDWLGRRIHTAG